MSIFPISTIILTVNVSLIFSNCHVLRACIDFSQSFTYQNNFWLDNGQNTLCFKTFIFVLHCIIGDLFTLYYHFKYKRIEHFS